MEAVETKLRELIARLDQSEGGAKESLRGSLPEPRLLALRIEDLDREYWTVLADGRMGDLETGRPEEEPHIRIRTTSDDLVALLDGDLPLVPAFLTGRIRIDASVADMLQLRKML